MINKQAVISSNISSVGWDNGVMEVTFTNGSTYQAENVPETEFKNLIAAKSVGKYFNANLKQAFVFKKVG